MKRDDLHNCGPGWQVWDCEPTVHPDTQINGGLVWAVTEDVSSDGEIITAYRTVMKVGRSVRFNTIPASAVRQVEPYSSSGVRTMIRHLGGVIGSSKSAISGFDGECLDCLHRLAQAL